MKYLQAYITHKHVAYSSAPGSTVLDLLLLFPCNSISEMVLCPKLVLHKALTSSNHEQRFLIFSFVQGLMTVTYFNCMFFCFFFKQKQITLWFIFMRNVLLHQCSMKTLNIGFDCWLCSELCHHSACRYKWKCILVLKIDKHQHKPHLVEKHYFATLLSIYWSSVPYYQSKDSITNISKE